MLPSSEMLSDAGPSTETASIAWHATAVVLMRRAVG